MKQPTRPSSQVGAARHPPPTAPHILHGAERPSPLLLPSVVITLVFLTLLTVLVVIIVYLYRNKGSYLTYEQPAAEADAAVQMEDDPCKEKEEYFI